MLNLAVTLLQSAEKNHQRILIEDNQAEDMAIKKLEKLLGIKQDRKSYLRGFVDDGLDYLLDFCDRDRRKQIMLAEGLSHLVTLSICSDVA